MAGDGHSDRAGALVAKGQVEVLAGDGKRLTQLGDSDHFGEIALLRSVPRTATVRTLTDTLLLVLSREVFLEALNADLSLSARVEKIVASRLTDEPTLETVAPPSDKGPEAG